MQAESIFQVALEIGQKRRENLLRLKSALERGDNEEALKLAKQLCGVDDEKGDRIDKGIH